MMCRCLVVDGDGRDLPRVGNEAHALQTKSLSKKVLEPLSPKPEHSECQQTSLVGVAV